MADENTIGVKAELDLSDWTPSQKQLEAALDHVNSIIDKATKKARENAKRVAEAEKQSTDAHKKAASEAEKAAKAEEAAANKRERSIRKFMLASAIVAAAVVKGYQAMRDAAKELGDTEAVAKFDEIDATIGALRDTFLTTGLEILKVSGFLDTIAGGLTALNQLVIMSGAGLVGFASIVRDVLSAGEKFKNYPGLRGRAEPLDTAGIMARAQEASRNALLAAITAPERRKEAEAQSDAEKEYKKAQDKKAKDLEDYISKTHDLTIKSGESILEAEKDYHDKSAEAWQSYMEKVADITASGIQKRADLARDYSDKIADAETGYQRSIEDTQYNHGQKLVDIERDYQDAIRNAQQNYQTDALDAIRNLDAIGLIRAKEKRDKDLANAETSRNEANTAENENYSRQLYEAQRAFEDKRREAEIAYQRGLEDQKRAEAQALQEAKNTYNQQVADAAKGYADKQAAIDQAYRNENAAAAAQYGYSEQAYRNHLVAMRNILAQYGIGNVTPTERTQVRRRAEGGLDLVSSPTHFLAGEAGPEIVYTAPLNRSVPVAAPQVIQHTGDFQHSIDSTIRSSVAGIDGRIVAAVSKVLREVLG